MMQEYGELLDRENQWNAVLCAVVANGYSKKRVKPEDFLPKKEAQTPEQMLAVVKQFVR